MAKRFSRLMTYERISGEKRPEDESVPFTGELMTCVLCGKAEQSDAGIDSSWRMLELGDGVRYYVCPGEFPPDGAGAAAFKQAYRRVLLHIINLSIKEE